jgi:hypothetical protein
MRRYRKTANSLSLLERATGEAAADCEDPSPDTSHGHHGSHRPPLRGQAIYLKRLAKASPADQRNLSAEDYCQAAELRHETLRLEPEAQQ